LEIRLPVELRIVNPEGDLADGDGASVSTIIRTVTRNISTGGMYLELDEPGFQSGDRLSVQIKIPPAEGVSAYPGVGTCEAEVLRCAPSSRDSTGAVERYGIAARFLDRLRITY
jgi:hypothetical protein